MKTIAKIRENDERTGKIIRIGYRRHVYNDERGWQVCASNGDKIGYYEPQPKDKCIAAIYAMYDRWDTFEAV